ncbi:formate dehydrogenase [Motiliproteus coralliicola]|uniref:Formate dehydrogenase n=1 Tax=Motiliproteus coralliicola TaxID=2283196 RepID=A0A369WTT0_9GAMM|nr:twin-arginine translocation signal domain-containing protein [Motiliproteus coralliicola]RDE22905.1 formate dehydrogenase [Motiliproteus coralliicola]
MSRTKADVAKPEADNSRRQFIKTLGAAGGAVAVATVAGEAAAEAVDINSDQPEQPKKSQGYEKTDHVRAYYDSARI